MTSVGTDCSELGEIFDFDTPTSNSCQKDFQKQNSYYINLIFEIKLYYQGSVTKPGSRLRMVAEVGYAARFPVTHGYGPRLRSPVPGYVWLRKTVTLPGSRLRMVTVVGYAARFPVTYGYVSRLRSPVPGYAWLRKLAKKMRNGPVPR